MGSASGNRSSRTPLPQPRWLARVSRPGRCGAAASAALLAALCYWNSLQGEFVHDDVWAIVNNPDVRPGASPLAAFSNDFWGKGMGENTSHKSYRPLCILTFRLNILLAGMNPFYFHALNVVLHCLVTLVLMYTCDKTVFKDSGLAFVTALFFAAHPIHTEAVTGIVGRADVLACLLFLLAFLSYNRSVDQLYVGEHFPPTASPSFLLLSLFLGTCAMLVKETGITVFGVCLVYDGFLLSQNGSRLKNGGLHVKMARQPAVSLQTPLHFPSSSRENGKHRVAHKGTWNSCHPASPEEQQGNGHSVLRKAPWAVLSYLTASNKQKFLYSTRPFLKRAALVLTYVILLMYFRLWIMGGSMPAFSEQDNPASFSPYLLTRFLTYSYLLAFNAWLLLAPITLCYDWQVGSIPLVESIWDLRNFATLILAFVMLLLCLHCFVAFKKLEHREILVGLLFLIFPFLPASNLFFRVGFVVAERILYMPRLYPRHASALNNLGTLTKDMAQAKEYYTKALQLNPQHNRVLFNLGNLLKNQGKKEEAVLLLRNSIQYGPDFSDAYSSLASLLAEQEQLKEAEEVYQAGIENCPESSDLHNNYGVFLVDTGSPETAVSHYQKAIELSPGHHVAMVNLGRLYRSLGQNKNAEVWYKRALKVARKVEILSPLGALYYNTGRYEDALKIYREAASLQPSNKETRLALAQVLTTMGQAKEAEQMLSHIVTEGAECLECYRLLSAIYSKQENYNKALEAIDKALQLKPKDPKIISELFFTKGNQLREQNHLDKAFESYKVSVDFNPEQAQAWMNMGGIEHIKGNYITARQYYEKALQLVPNSKLLKENLAKLDRLERRLQEGRGRG
ncbi:protein O-mannosyl-transferase TMTC1 isoform X5 [Ahaetulla prasina]|uniref:protein O-mannosyl-transferase TMTC1 isoform X5 n=1 Tax=Ahaetulla prasina TaxID=499056 RepID=UPI002648E9D8|nr:protein O-mannosyl-transferase TMTC1 isoform X5 [Ahaetulla prasina]